MDHDEPLLDLSDVVHDEPLDEDHLDSISRHRIGSESMSPLPADHFAGPLSLDAELDALHSAVSHTHSQVHLPLTGVGVPSFSVEQLEREIASLLSQNASVASAALLSAAAHHRQAEAEHQEIDNHSDRSGLATDMRGAEALGMLGLNLTGLAAVLQAAHAQAEENERAAEALAATHPELVRRREEEEHTKNKTRSAPAFHSLTADEDILFGGRASSASGNASGTDGSEYLYDEDLDSERDEERAESLDRGSSPLVRSDSAAAGDSSPVSPEFTDISDILTHFTHFDRDDDEPTQIDDSEQVLSPAVDTTPTVLRYDRLSSPEPSDPGVPAEPMSPVIFENFDHDFDQPVASTSSGPGTASEAEGKKVKKNKDTKKQPREKVSQTHVCEQCSKTFSRRSDLQRHMRIHTGERPFICPETGCGKTFIQRSALHVHLRVHTGEKPHICEYPGCARTFGDSSSLARHRRTHTGKRPYKCEDPVCEKTFTRRTTLTAHMRTHDPSWEPDPNIKYNFKAKRPKMDSGDIDQQLEASVRSLSALLASSGAHGTPLNLHLGSAAQQVRRPGNIGTSNELVGVLKSPYPLYEDEEEEDEEESDDPEPEMADLQDDVGARVSKERVVVTDTSILESLGSEDDAERFPIPLRVRKGQEISAVVTGKRKR